MSARGGLRRPRGLSGVGLFQKLGGLAYSLIYIYDLVGCLGFFLVIFKGEKTLMLGNIEDRRRKG